MGYAWMLWAGEWARGEPATCLDWLCPCPSSPRTDVALTGCWGWAGALGTGTELWSRKGLRPEAFGSQRARGSQAGCLLDQHSSLDVLSGSYQAAFVLLAFLLGPDTFPEWTFLTGVDLVPLVCLVSLGWFQPARVDACWVGGILSLYSF